MHKVLRVSSLQATLAAVFASLTFVVTYYVDIVAKLSGQSNISETILRQTLGDQISGFSEIGTVNTVVIVLFWSVVGLIAYTAVWALVSLYTEAHNEVKVEQEYTNRGVLQERLRIPLIRVGIIILMVLLLSLTLKVLWPYWLGLFGQFLNLTGVSLTGAISYLLAAYLGAMLNLYLFKVGISAIRSLS